MVLVVEVIGGLLSGSLALLADAGHMLTDATGLVLALIGASLGTRAASARRTYGMQRAEVLAALSNALLLVGVAVWVLIQAVDRLREPGEVETALMLAVAVVGALANTAGLLLLRRGQAESLNVRGAYLEVLDDLLGSVAVIVAAVLIMLTGWTRFDALASLLIFVLIVPRAWTPAPGGGRRAAGGHAARGRPGRRSGSTSAGCPAWSTCTTCTSGPSPAAYRCCPRTWSSTRRASARAAPARCWTGSASAWAGTSTSSTAPSSWSRSGTRTTSRRPMPDADPATFAAPLDVAGRRVLVCGGGPAALGPVRALLEARAEVLVVGPEIGPTIADLAARRR